jgi:hypothetical protein
MSRNGINPFRRDSGGVEQDTSTPSLDLVSWLRLIVGGMTAIRPWIEHIQKNTDFGPYLCSELWTVNRVPETNEQAQRDAILKDLEQLWTVKGTTTSGVERESYNGPHVPAIAYLSMEARTALSETLASLRKVYLWVTFRADVGLKSASQLPMPSDSTLPQVSAPSRSFFPLFITSAPLSSMSMRSSQQTSPSPARPIELSAILLFLHSLTDSFLMLLQQQQPFALIIMAHYAVLIQQKDIWWMRGLGEDMLAWVIDGLAEQAFDTETIRSEQVPLDAGNKPGAYSEWLPWVAWPRAVCRNVGSASFDRESGVHKT